MTQDRSDEFGLIEECLAGRGGPRSRWTRLGIGDDASLHACPNGHEWVVSTDTSVEGVHWPADFPLADASDKAVCAALSDLAAMGARPQHAWLNLLAPDPGAIRELAEGATRALARYKVELAGGDLSRAPFGAVAVTVAGLVPEGGAMLRSAAKAGEELWLAGRVGFHALGLEQWLAGQRRRYFVHYFREIRPRIEEGVRLRELGIRCCIDVSDGLVQDAGHIARASSVGIELDVARLPGWDILCRKAGRKAALRAALGGGEDYALLFTAPRGMGFLEGFAVRIGRIVEGEGVQVFEEGKSLDVSGEGFRHFA